MASLPPTITVQQQSIFDEELAFLATVQSRFLHLHQQVPVAFNDPDVKRLIEAMAAFMAKGRIAGTIQIDQLHQRVFQQLLPYIASPISSMGLVQANSQYISEATQLNHGAAFSVTSDDDDKADYVGMHGMPLRPITIGKLGLAANTADRINSQLNIMLNSLNGMPGHLQHLPLYLDVNNNYAATRQFIKLLSSKLVSVKAVFDNQSEAIAGDFSFGACQSPEQQNMPLNFAIDHQSSGLHPIEKIRRFFQLPQQENYLNLYFSDSPQYWQTCELQLHFESPWPSHSKPSASFIKLGMICVENVLKELAESFSFDATCSANTLRPPSTTPDLKLLKCLGVYQGAVKERQLLSPGILKSGNGAYELHLQGSALPLIDIQLSEAFTKPVKISIEALWHQPDFSVHLWKNLRVRTSQLAIQKLSCDIYSAPVPHLPMSDNAPHSLLELSLLKNKDVLSLEEILFILDSLGSVFNREFKLIKPLLTELHVLAPNHYGFVVNNTNPQTTALLECFMAKLAQLLTLWLPVGPIQVSMQNQQHISQTLENADEYQEYEFIPEQDPTAATNYGLPPSSTMRKTPVDDKEESLLPQSVDILFDDEISQYSAQYQEVADD
ncbi:type VI secretion system baseplate subunit TssF [Paraglaciecola sp.]|uniref:type VI secretion system baseplate subunit TssF n=1 Tax=Paraglaciecola sp. TaxID=1920173 RepID=UPI0030F4094A